MKLIPTVFSEVKRQPRKGVSLYINRNCAQFTFIHDTFWETPSPESSTISVVLPDAYRDITARIATYIAGVLKFSNMICSSGVRILLLHLLNISLATCTHVSGPIRKNNLTYLGNFFSVCLWVQRCFSQKDWVFFGCYMKHVEEGVVLDVYNVVPLGHITMLNGIV